ncbi:hypothetical protein F8S13_22060 [Chloroflexia bacterium SDU3-3]|nr:hypothetical protein F8S13_22060 [Chloroflexia bacterium SDU3-3]
MPVAYREFAAVDNAVRRRADASSFRVTYTETMIEVFRRFESDVEDMLATFGIGPRSGQPPRSGSLPFLRCVLADEQARAFTVERYADGQWQLVADNVGARSLVGYVAERADMRDDD